MNVVAADACPLIFLAKLDRLDLVRGVLSPTVWIPEAVHRELLAGSIPAPDHHRIVAFLRGCRIVPVPRPGYPSRSLALADRCLLALAARHPGTILLADDALVRRIAESEGRRVAGTLGVLIRAVRKGLLTRTAARENLDDLIANHRFRISVELYQEALRHLRP